MVFGKVNSVRYKGKFESRPIRNNMVALQDYAVYHGTGLLYFYTTNTFSLLSNTR